MLAAAVASKRPLSHSSSDALDVRLDTAASRRQGLGGNGVALTDAAEPPPPKSNSWWDPRKAKQRQQQQERVGPAQPLSEDGVWGGRAGGLEGENRRLLAELTDARAEIASLREHVEKAEASTSDATRRLISLRQQLNAAPLPPPPCVCSMGSGSSALVPFSVRDVSLGLLPRSPPGLLPASPGRALLSSWRSRSLDWHDLVPLVTEDADAAVGAAAKFAALVQGELTAISYLQGFLTLRGSRSGASTRLGAAELSGALGAPSDGADGGTTAAAAADPFDVSAFYAPSSDWGPFAKYAACPLLRDKCAVHATDRECVLDELCGVSEKQHRLSFSYYDSTV